MQTRQPAFVRLLLIEAEPRTASKLRRLIESSEAFRVLHEFPDATAAAHAIERESVDLVIADVSEAQIRNLGQLAANPTLVEGLPFIFVDSVMREDVAAWAREAGAQNYLVIPELTPDFMRRAIQWSIHRATEVKRLRRDVGLFHELLEHIPDRIYFKDRQSRFIRVSKSVADAHSVDDARTLIGKSDFMIYPPEQAEETFTDEQHVIETGEPIVNKVAPRTLPDGSQVWLSSTKMPLLNLRGVPVGTFGITRDLTALKTLEIQLGAERNRLRDANEELRTALAQLQTANEELRAVQLQLIEAEKLKSVGKLAAGVAHEVKNPLAIISMGLQFLAGKYPDDPTIAPVLAELTGAVERADNVVKGLLDFSAPRDLALVSGDINTALHHALNLVRGEIQSSMQIEERLEARTPVLMDESKLAQVFVNLLTNALHAMPEGGTLTVSSTERPGIPSEDANIHEGDRVVAVEIRDHGAGIPEDVLPRLFEPFFTTKSRTRGTGLGLSVARSIVRLHRGTIDLTNHPEGGAVATLQFKPLAAK